MGISRQFILTIFFSFLSISVSFTQNNVSFRDTVDLTVIDSYVTPEIPHCFMLTFFTSVNCKSSLIIDNKYEYTVSDTLTVNHSIKIDLTKLVFKTKSVPYVIVVQDSTGKKYESDGYDFELPGEVIVQHESNFLLLCLFGGVVFALPSPTYVTESSGNYFSLVKEIPVISFRSSNFTYPFGYISLEYAHIFNAPEQNYFRIGYKHIFILPVIEFVSPGIDGFTNFNSFNGISLELSIGWFRIFNTFTVYSKYRFNIKPSDNNTKFHEFSIGLYSSFFSVYF